MNILEEDLEHILKHTEPLWQQLKGKRIFITGGTGFFGCWLLESFIWANEKLNLGSSAVVLTRNSATFEKKAPHLANDNSIEFLTGDITSFDFPRQEFSYIIHAATEASAKLNQENPLLMLDTIVQGTRHVLDFARACGSPKMLLTSSGAVYGRQPAEITHVAEDYLGSPDLSDPASAYAEGKRLAEMLCTLYSKQYGLDIKIARCFAFVGPYLPLDIHFAIGNFIKNTLEGEPINITGDGTPYRSYLYAADLMIWLWTILFQGKTIRPYNVGSQEALSIKETALAVAKNTIPVHIAQKIDPNKPVSRYVPSTQRAFSELELSTRIDLDSAINKTIEWNLSNSKKS
jgi:dTDP-glucose 4,6-dehydratase